MKVAAAADGEHAVGREQILYLTLCWGLTLTTSTLLTTVGPLSALELGTPESLAPFTIGVFLLGAAISAVPSGELFRAFGRYFGFSVGCIFQILGSLLGGIGLVSKISGILFLGCSLVGVGQGLGQFYRFAAVEISPDHMKSIAVTCVLSGGIVAAILGPTLAKYTSKLLLTQYSGCFFVMGILGIFNWIILSRVSFPKREIDVEKCDDLPRNSRPLLTIISQPLFILSCSIATIAHTVMVMIMSNCALSMTSNHSLGSSTLVLEMHFIAMFSPGFVTGVLIKRYGPFLISFYGAVIFASSSILFAFGTELWNYYSGMILLGIAWNFSYSSATIMLTRCYEACEAPHVQAINDFILFTTSGVGCLISGMVFSFYNWSILIYSASVLMGFNFVLFFIAWKLEPRTHVHSDDESSFRLLPNENSPTCSRAESIDRVRQLSVA